MTVDWPFFFFPSESDYSSIDLKLSCPCIFGQSTHVV